MYLTEGVLCVNGRSTLRWGFWQRKLTLRFLGDPMRRREDRIMENQELYTKWMKECPGSEHVSIELSNDKGDPYCWKIGATDGSGRGGYVILNGIAINGTEAQKRETLCRRLKSAIAAFS